MLFDLRRRDVNCPFTNDRQIRPMPQTMVGIRTARSIWGRHTDSHHRL
jgi:hypothetical protein